jgi:hypothetical protein
VLIVLQSALQAPVEAPLAAQETAAQETKAELGEDGVATAEPPVADLPKEEPTPAVNVTANVGDPAAGGDGGSKKRPLDEAAAAEGAPQAKQHKQEDVVGGNRVRANQNHPAAIAMRKRNTRKAPTAPLEPEVLFPVGVSPIDVYCPRRLRTATPRRPRSSRAAWGRLKQVPLCCGVSRAACLLGCSTVDLPIAVVLCITLC